MSKRTIIVCSLAAGALALVASAFFVRFDYAPLPDEAALVNRNRHPVETVYDVLGHKVDTEEADRLRRTADGRDFLSPENGAIALNEALIERGREAFYRETFGNEVFLTDVMGMLDGALSPWSVARALVALKGQGTSDLKVRLAKSVTIGGRNYEAGTLVSTGLDVARGSFAALGLKIFYDRGRIRAGITCAACHAAVDPQTGLVAEGVPNADFNVGLLLALSSNSAAYFVHTTMPSLDPFLTGASPRVPASDGREERLPDPDRFEAAVDAMIAAWPPGSFDSTVDLVNNPTSIPDSFTKDADPYGWTGFAAIGPFRGLTSFNNNVHALNSDETAMAAAAPDLFHLDPEVYLGTLLQRASNPDFRFHVGAGMKPSQLLAAGDPTPGAPGINHYAVLPTFPRANYMTTNSLFASAPGEPVGYATNAMSAFQNRLRPPFVEVDPTTVAEGQRVFAAAGCGTCHSGPALTNNAVISLPEIGTEPTRARALAATEQSLAQPAMFAPDVPFPPRAGAALVEIPMTPDQLAETRLAWAHGGTPGGYKVKALVGLAWSAPYLHDGGVAVGPDPEFDVGLIGTFQSGVAPNARNSLQALLDRKLRDRVVAANRASATARTSHVTGEGHRFFVDDASGFSEADRTALISYLLSR